MEEISYIDFPELKIDEHESTEMPFRYVKDESGSPIMPKVSKRDLWSHNAHAHALTGYD